MSDNIRTFAELNAFLALLAIPLELRIIAEIDTEISVADYSKAIKNGNRVHYNVAIKETSWVLQSDRGHGLITSDMCKLLNIVILVGIIPKRWCKVVGVLLEKDPGHPNLNRLRVIHLFEAYYNLFLKLLLAHASQNNVKSAGQSSYSIKTKQNRLPCKLVSSGHLRSAHNNTHS